MATSTLRRHQASCRIFSVMPQTLVSPNTKSLNKRGGKQKRRGERNTFLPLPSTVAEGAGTLVEDAALPLRDSGTTGGIKWHLFTICLFPIGKFMRDKSKKVNEKNQPVLASADALAAEGIPSPV